jgi:O-Antigen ligase
MYTPALYRMYTRAPLSPRILLLGLLIPIAGGKWGSYLGFPSYGVYLSDVCIGLGIFGMLSTRTAWENHEGSHRSIQKHAGASLLLLGSAVFCFIELRRGEGSLSLRIRDLAPFLYLMLFPFVRAGLHQITGAVILRYLDCALWVHTIWTVPAIFGILPALGVATQSSTGFPIFGIRPDIDMPLLIVFLGSTLRRAKMSPILKISIASLAVASSLEQSSRAAFAGAAVAAVLIFAYTQTVRRRRPAGLIVACAAVAVMAALVPLGSTLPASFVGTGALGRAGLIPTAAGKDAAAGGDGTAGGRQFAWKRMLGYYDAQGSPVLGLGPGTEVVRDSGALAYLSGDPTVRAPHNWWVGLYVRYGPVGAAIWLVLLILAARGLGAFGNKTRAREPWETELRAVGLGLTAAILVAGSLGVLVESPFGSQPLLLATGLIWVASDRSLRTSTTRPASRHTQPLVPITSPIRGCQ